MKQYTKPEFELVILDMHDIIATSDPLDVLDGEITDPGLLGAPNRPLFDLGFDFLE